MKSLAPRQLLYPSIAQILWGNATGTGQSKGKSPIFMKPNSQSFLCHKEVEGIDSFLIYILVPAWQGDFSYSMVLVKHNFLQGMCRASLILLWWTSCWYKVTVKGESGNGYLMWTTSNPTFHTYPRKQARNCLDPFFEMEMRTIFDGAVYHQEQIKVDWNILA